jgi:Fe2+ transport system protein FeoA
MDLGFLPGAEVVPILNNPLGDPRAFEVMGGVVAVRRKQAKLIEVTTEWSK